MTKKVRENLQKIRNQYAKSLVGTIQDIGADRYHHLIIRLADKQAIKEKDILEALALKPTAVSNG